MIKHFQKNMQLEDSIRDLDKLLRKLSLDNKLLNKLSALYPFEQNAFEAGKQTLRQLISKLYSDYIQECFSNWFLEVNGTTIFEIAFNWLSLRELQAFFPKISLTSEEGFYALYEKLPHPEQRLAWLLAYLEQQRIYAARSNDLPETASDLFKKIIQAEKEAWGEESLYEALDTIEFAHESPMRWMLTNAFEKEALSYFYYLYQNQGETLEKFYRTHCISHAILHNRATFLTGVFTIFDEEKTHTEAMNHFHNLIRNLNDFGHDSCLKQVLDTLPVRTQLELVQKDLSRDNRYNLLDFIVGSTKKSFPLLANTSPHVVEKLLFTEHTPLEVKKAWLKRKAYEHAESNRTHNVVIENNGVQGDALKAEILNRFDNQLRQCNTLEEIEEVVQEIRSEDNADYAILKTGQDSFTRSSFARFFGITTSSVKAFKTLEAHHKERVHQNELLLTK